MCATKKYYDNYICNVYFTATIMYYCHRGRGLFALCWICSPMFLYVSHWARCIIIFIFHAMSVKFLYLGNNGLPLEWFEPTPPAIFRLLVRALTNRSRCHLEMMKKKEILFQIKRTKGASDHTNMHIKIIQICTLWSYKYAH
jgi:hypothetical protein